MEKEVINLCNISKLDRSIIKVFGKDSKKFLQGLISNDVNLLATNGALYSGLFTNKGRYNFDFFVIFLNDYYLLDIASSRAADLIKMLGFYKLISNVKIEVITDLKVYGIFNNGAILQEEFLEGRILYEDKRLKEMGYRLIAKDLSIEFQKFNMVSVAEYNYLRYQNAIMEVDEFVVEKTIPIECGFDELNAISYTKGCYLGQEFTNSAKNRLAIRKRVVPFFMQEIKANIGDKVFLLEDIGNNTANDVGEVIAQVKDFALIMFKMQYKNQKIHCNGKEITMKLPTWIKTYES